MAAQFIVGDGMVSIRFEWLNVPTARAQEIVEYCALYDHRRGLGPVDEEGDQVPFDELTNQQQLDMVYAAAQRLIIAQARTAYINEAQIAAQDTAAEYADGEFDLG